MSVPSQKPGWTGKAEEPVGWLQEGRLQYLEYAMRQGCLKEGSESWDCFYNFHVGADWEKKNRLHFALNKITKTCPIYYIRKIVEVANASEVLSVRKCNKL